MHLVASSHAYANPVVDTSPDGVSPPPGSTLGVGPKNLPAPCSDPRHQLDTAAKLARLVAASLPRAPLSPASPPVPSGPCVSDGSVELPEQAGPSGAASRTRNRLRTFAALAKDSHVRAPPVAEQRRAAGSHHLGNRSGT